jgi:NADH dehydrogenase
VRGEIPGSPGEIPQARNGQVEVSPTLQAPIYPEVYVIGDLARFMEAGQTLPMVAPVAMQQGLVAAQNILRQINGQAPQPFHYRDPGTMVTIGRNAAVAYIKGRSFTGFFAWLVWLGVHLFRLIGFRNRLVVMFNWAWDYLFYERSVRLIIPLGRKEK